jgi:hypothetical protein
MTTLTLLRDRDVLRGARGKRTSGPPNPISERTTFLRIVILRYIVGEA